MNEEEFAAAMSDILEHAVDAARDDHRVDCKDVMLAGIAVELRCIRLILESRETDGEDWKW